MAIAVSRRQPADRTGLLLAGLGVVTFSLTFPATAWALDGLGAWTVTSARIVLAGLLATACLAAARVPRPARRHWAGLATVALGCVAGFPLLTTLALTTASTSHAAVVVGLLPLTTTGYVALRSGARLSPVFWAAALAGAAVVLAFAVRHSGGAPATGDLYLFAALLVCAAGYGEGGRLAAELPGWQVISWALAACLPLALPGLLAALWAEPARLTGQSAAGLLWLAAGSQFLGLVVWYRGLARAGTARASQLQLAQPLLTLGWSAALLGEHLGTGTALAALAVLGCIAVTQRAAAPRPAPDRAPGRRLGTRDEPHPEDGRELLMRANVGDRLKTHGRIVGQHDRECEIVEVMGDAGEPPYRVRFEDGHETVMSPGPDSVVEHLSQQRRDRA